MPYALEQPRHGGIVDAGDNHAPLPHARSKNVERILDSLEAAVVLEVIGLDVRDDGDLGMELVEGAVVLVGLHDQEVAAAALGIAAEVAAHAANQNGRIEPCLFEHGGDERRRCGLAVRAGDADGALAVDDLAEELFALHDADAAGAGGIELAAVSSDGAGDDHEGGAVDVRGVVAGDDVDAALGEKVGGGGALQVAAGDAESLAAQDLSN